MDIITEHRASNSFSDSWNAINKLNVDPGLPVSVQGVSNTGKIADLFNEHFKVISSFGPSSAVIDVWPVLTYELYLVSAE